MLQERLANVERFDSLADRYDAARPAPPQAVVDFLCAYAMSGRPTESAAVPELVLDLGCGTGLSTRVWTGRARAVIGVEPNDEMRIKAVAESRGLPDVSYRAGSSMDTGLPAGAADIVTCSQSFHWMDPLPTLAEIDRLLRPGGVFAAIDCDWPPVVDWRVDQAYLEMKRITDEMQTGHPGIRAHRWSKNRHLENMRESGRFAFVREALFHGVERGDAARMVNLALSQGGVAALLRLGAGEDELGLTGLRRAAGEALGGRTVPFTFCYRVRVGVKAPA